MNIKLNKAYVSRFDNVEYPIFKLPDSSYVCIAYSLRHDNYYINTYTAEEFEEQGFKESSYDEYRFCDLTRKDINL